MAERADDYDVVIVGAGLSGLTTAYWLKKLAPSLSICILERSGEAGGLTGDWKDLRFGADKRLQPPMHMIFKSKYKNLLNLIHDVDAQISDEFPDYRIITSDGVDHHLSMDDWASKNLPPPFHAIGMLWKLDIPLMAKWDLAKLVAVGASCTESVARGEQEPPRIPNTMSLESLELLLGMGPEARDFLETVTPSIYNPHPWYTAAPRMAGVTTATMALDKDSLHYHVYSKSYNPAIADKLTALLTAQGVSIRLRHDVRRIDALPDGSRVEAVWVRPYGEEVDGATAYVCQNCGARCFALDRAFCSRCGEDTTLDAIRDGRVKRPAGNGPPEDPKADGCERIGCKYLVTAMYPHMITPLLPKESKLREDPYVRSLFSSRGNQTQLSIGRVYYKEPVTRGEKIITGTHNPTFAFNGCQSVFNVFGAEDLGWQGGGDVVDVLLDVGVIRDAHTQEVQKRRIVKDLKRVYPDADPALVEHVSFANMYPSALYLTEQPAIAGLHRFFYQHKTGASNWFVAGCHAGRIGIGMESAVESAMSAANCVLEAAGVSDRAEIVPITIPTGSKLLARFGDAILWWKASGDLKRRAGSTYSMPDDG
jgi:hypothetical protein